MLGSEILPGGSGPKTEKLLGGDCTDGGQRSLVLVNEGQIIIFREFCKADNHINSLGVATVGAITPRKLTNVAKSNPFPTPPTLRDSGYIFTSTRLTLQSVSPGNLFLVLNL